MDILRCYRPPLAACVIFITQSNKGGGVLARDPGPPGLRCLRHLRPLHLLLPPSMFATLGGLRLPRRSAPPPTLKTIVVHQLNEYRNMTMLLYLHSLEHYLSNDTKIKQKYGVLNRSRRKKSPATQILEHSPLSIWLIY